MQHRAPAEQATSLLVVGTTGRTLGALRVFFEALNPTFGGCVVIACDGVEPDRVVAELTPTIRLQLVAAADGRCRAERGRVHAVCSSANLTFEGQGPPPARQDGGGPIRSALAWFGPSVVALTLSDAPVFSLAELDAVRETGGLIIHERGDGGRAIGTAELGVSQRDLAATVEELFEYVHHPDAAEVRMLQKLLEELCRQSGIDFGDYKSATIMRRLARVMGRRGFGSIADYLAELREHPEGYGSLVRSLLVNVTDFFRDPPLFDYLRDEVVPHVIDYASRQEKEVRVWSAGCATGEEAYSLAILLCEALGERINDYHVRIFATDLDDEAVAVARRGVYPAAALKDVPPQYVAPYFIAHENGHEVGPSIRKLTTFGQHDLAQRAPFPRIDLVLCRNVLMYFTKELQQRSLQLFAFSLRHDGYLVLGKAETTSPLPEYFRPVHRTFKVYQRDGPQVLIPRPESSRRISPPEPIASALLREAAKTRSRAAAAISTASQASGATVSRPSARPLEGDHLAALLSDSPVGLVIVDRRYDIVAINQTARTLLNVHGTCVGEDLLHAASGIATIELRVAIDTAFADEAAPEPREFEVLDALSDTSRTMELTCQALRSGDESPQTVSIVMVDISSHVERRAAAERLSEELQARIDEMTAKIENLRTRQRALLTANDEFTSANVELRGSNEHLILAAEEAASVAEEIETLNETMQATNEELETLNEELQATVEELNSTNDELEARSAEYEELAKTRERQRVELERERDHFRRALDALDGTFVIFAADGTVMYENPRYRTFFSRGQVTFSEDGKPAVSGRDPLTRARRGETFRQTYRAVFADGTTVEVRARARPYPSDDGSVQGILLELGGEFG